MYKIAMYLKTSFFVTNKEIPKAITNWVNENVGRVIKYSIQHAKEINIDTPWHEADKIYYALFELTENNNAKITSMQFTRSGMESAGERYVKGSGVIPSGFVMVEAHTYPKSAYIYTSGDTQKFIPQKDFELLDEELLILQFSQSLTSSFRPIFKDQSLYTSLVEKGLLKGNKAITVDGRNALETFRSQLKNIDPKKFTDEYGNGMGDIFIKNHNEVRPAILSIR
jgi:hypothetical protein